MRINSFQAIIFDMDGVILDTEKIYRRAFQGAIRELGSELTDLDYLDLLGRNRGSCTAVLLGKFGSDFPIDRIYEKLGGHCERLIAEHGINTKAGIHDLLDFLDEHNKPRAIATSTHTAHAWNKLQHVNLHNRFEIVVGGDQVRESKPSPEIYLRAAAKLGVNPEACLALEDSEAGIRAAHGAGMQVIMVPDLRPADEVIRPLTAEVLESLAIVRDFLKAVIAAA